MKHGLFIFLIVAMCSLLQAQDMVILANDSVVVLDEPDNEFEGSYLMLGVGMGGNYSGLVGVSATFRLGGALGVGFHAGVGLLPGTPLVYNAGLKFYPKRGFFLDAQFGKIKSGTDYSDWDWVEKNYYGPTFMVGWERAWGRVAGVGFTIAAGATWVIGDGVIPMGQMGFVVRIPVGD